jgi:hypothetical protein
LLQVEGVEAADEAGCASTGVAATSPHPGDAEKAAVAAAEDDALAKPDGSATIGFAGASMAGAAATGVPHNRQNLCPSASAAWQLAQVSKAGAAAGVSTADSANTGAAVAQESGVDE